ncbi:MAG: DUF4417 domain-containing protein [Clostridiales bacterium]|nr:DUF4417 domain-containing protein [Clostridiales bacterium]
MLSNNIVNYNNKPREGCKDLLNAALLSGASYTQGNDIPICQKSNGTIPNGLISYDDAKSLHSKLIKKNPEYHIDKHVHFFVDDQKFDGVYSSIWAHPEKLLDLLRHFDGAISPDFSTNADFPDPEKRHNTYRMRVLDYFLQSNGISIIHNVRWGTCETWSYCFDGIPLHAIIAIGVVASGINKVVNRRYFYEGLMKAIEFLEPLAIVVYGSDNYDVFDDIRSRGIKVIAFPSKTNLAFAKEGEV